MSEPETATKFRSRLVIWIEPYYRIKDGKIQHVRGHYRAVKGSVHSNVLRFTPRA